MKKLLTTPFEIRRPFRLWMTGSIAVVMAAVMPIRDISQGERSHLLRLLRHSQFGVNETVRRLQAPFEPYTDTEIVPVNAITGWTAG